MAKNRSCLTRLAAPVAQQDQYLFFPFSPIIKHIPQLNFPMQFYENKRLYLIVVILFTLGSRCISLQVLRSGSSIDFSARGLHIIQSKIISCKHYQLKVLELYQSLRLMKRNYMKLLHKIGSLPALRFKIFQKTPFTIAKKHEKVRQSDK